MEIIVFGYSNEVVWDLHMMSTHPPVYINGPLNYLEFLSQGQHHGNRLPLREQQQNQPSDAGEEAMLFSVLNPQLVDAVVDPSLEFLRPPHPVPMQPDQFPFLRTRPGIVAFPRAHCLHLLV